MPDTTVNRGYRIPKSDGTDAIGPDDIRIPLTSVDTDMNNIYDAWATYVPVIAAAGGGLDIKTSAGGFASGRVKQIGKTAFVSGVIHFGTGATFGTGVITISLPATSLSANSGDIGQAAVLPSGSTTFWGMGWVTTTGPNLEIYISGSATGAGTAALTGTSTPIGTAWHDGAEIRYNLSYEVA